MLRRSGASPAWWPQQRTSSQTPTASCRSVNRAPSELPARGHLLSLAFETCGVVLMKMQGT